MTNEKNLGAQGATEDVSAGSIASDAASARHTPGPWDDASRYDNISTIRIFAGVHYIATVGGPDDDFNQTDANAHLIAAAPELLEALRAFTNDDFLNTYDSSLCWGCGELKSAACAASCLLARARAAIAKAEGRS